MTTIKARLAALALLGIGVSLPATAHHEGEVVSAGGLVVSHAWTYENAAMAHAVDVYLTIRNEGDAPDRLVGAAVDFAPRVEIQAQVLGDDGVLKTRTVEALEVAPGQTLTLQPGGVRLVLMSVQRQFEHGQHFDLQLRFAQAGSLVVEVEIEEAGEPHEHEQSS